MSAFVALVSLKVVILILLHSYPMLVTSVYGECVQ